MWVAHDAALVVGDALVGGDGGVAGGGHPAEPLVRAFRFRYILNYDRFFQTNVPCGDYRQDFCV